MMNGKMLETGASVRRISWLLHGTQPETLQIGREQQVLKILVIDKLRAFDNFLGCYYCRGW